MKITWKTEADATAEGLIQLSIWLYDSPQELDVLMSMYRSVMKNEHRKAMFVRCPIGSRIALFVDDITAKETHKRPGRE